MKIEIFFNNLSYKPVFPNWKLIKTRGIINDNSWVCLWLIFVIMITWRIK
jgi:hypothetical protein